jgi:hypothetical protein
VFSENKSLRNKMVGHSITKGEYMNFKVKGFGCFNGSQDASFAEFILIVFHIPKS